MTRLLLDANTLLLLFVGIFDREQVSTFKRTRQFSPEDFDLLVELIEPFGKLVTTPGILTEVSNLSGHFVDDVKVKFFGVFAEALTLVDEHYVPSAEVATHGVFTRLGLTDAMICHLAETKGLVVLTTDLDLWAHLSSKKVRCHNFNHIRSSRILPSAP